MKGGLGDLSLDEIAVTMRVCHCGIPFDYRGKSGDKYCLECSDEYIMSKFNVPKKMCDLFRVKRAAKRHMNKSTLSELHTHLLKRRKQLL